MSVSLRARHELRLRCPSVCGLHRLERDGGPRCDVSHLENCRASTSILFFQATKSQRWMPWRQEPMKDVSDCEKPRGVVD